MNNTDILAITGLALTTAFGISGWLLYLATRRLKQPTWAIQSNNLIQGYWERLPKLNIQYEGTPVEDLTVSKVWFWNRGRDSISQEDVASLDPLRIDAMEKTMLMGVKILHTNSAASNFSCSLSDDRKSAQIRFEFLDHNEGAIIQVVHTGTSSNDIQVKGKVKGSSQLTRMEPQSLIRPYSSRLWEWAKIFALVSVPGISGLLLLGSLGWILNSLIQTGWIQTIIPFMVFVGIVVVIVVAALWWLVFNTVHGLMRRLPYTLANYLERE